MTEKLKANEVAAVKGVGRNSKVVHVIELVAHNQMAAHSGALCGERKERGNWYRCTREVTCRKCLKILTEREGI